MTCECGCGYEGEDPVTQYLVEEACVTALDAWDAARIAEQARDEATAAAQERVQRQLEDTRRRSR